MSAENYSTGDQSEDLESQRPMLYDYLFRMTGEAELSVNSVDEVIRAVGAAATSTPLDLKIVLYQTARNFNSPAWNADTADLINEGLTGEHEGQPVSDGPDSVQLELNYSTEFEEVFRTLPGPLRETLILCERSGFDHGATARVMGVREEQVAEWYEQGLAELERRLPDLHASQEVSAMMPHPLPASVTGSTVAISEVIANVRNARADRNLFLIGILVGMVIVGAIWLIWPEIF